MISSLTHNYRKHAQGFRIWKVSITHRNDPPSDFTGCFLGHNERYLHLTCFSSSSTIDVYIQSTYAPKEQLPMHLCKNIREDLIANPPQLCSGYCFLQMPVPNDGQNHN